MNYLTQLTLFVLCTTSFASQACEKQINTSTDTARRAARLGLITGTATTIVATLGYGACSAVEKIVCSPHAVDGNPCIGNETHKNFYMSVIQAGAGLTLSSALLLLQCATSRDSDED